MICLRRAGVGRLPRALGGCFFVVLLVLLCGQPIEAQPLRYGLKAGPSLTNIASSFPQENLDPSYGWRKGFSVLGIGEWGATSHLSLVTEMGYVQRGYENTIEARNEVGESLGTITETTSFGYASGAVLGKGRRPGSVTPYAVLGPRIDVLLHSSFHTPRKISGGTSENIVTRNYDTVTVGGTIGVGVETRRLFPGRAFVEMRYGTDVTDSLSSAPREIRNRTIDLLIGITF